MTTPLPGISGFAVYAPPYRVDLNDWCEWTGNDWGKVRTVIGRGFRMRGPNQNVYTMAANAVMRLINQYEVDPSKVRFLGLGTESSLDNSAGSVIVKGMVDRALRAEGQPPLSRNCEVPEFKHACLGSVYAMKNALRFLACDGERYQAIVVSADIAEYARGSTGEPTQGAGAVAMLLEAQPTMLEVNLAGSGSASDYRAVDFRKPLSRFCHQAPRHNGQVQDLPVFNGKYSTTCYSDETLHAVRDMFTRRSLAGGQYFRNLAAVFMHRPYHRMPQSAFALTYLFALAHGGLEDRTELRRYCDAAEVDHGKLVQEMSRSPSLLDLVEADAIGEEVYPLSMALLRPFRATDTYQELIEQKMQPGSESMMELGNLYTGALSGWLAAGCEDALRRGLQWRGRELLTIGYGSGDAAEAIPMRVVPGWEQAAGRIAFSASLGYAVNLTQLQYESLHDHGNAAHLPAVSEDEFVITRVGQRREPGFCDQGIEYYEFVRAREQIRRGTGTS
jgi:hydroxymethylglutaryl-CoA synthase